MGTGGPVVSHTKKTQVPSAFFSISIVHIFLFELEFAESHVKIELLRFEIPAGKCECECECHKKH
jgi:hypothetical protein